MDNCINPHGHKFVRPTFPHNVPVGKSQAEKVEEPIVFDSSGPGYRECWRCVFCNQTKLVNPASSVPSEE